MDIIAFYTAGFKLLKEISKHFLKMVNYIRLASVVLYIYYSMSGLIFLITDWMEYHCNKIINPLVTHLDN